MGMLIDGVWQESDGKWAGKDGEFRRDASQFRCHIGSDIFPIEADRYHLYVSLACPWAHRALIFRQLKDLQTMIPVTTVQAEMLEHGWQFAEPEPLYGFHFAHQLYSKAQADYSGRVTVPILWDKKQHRIVCNESADMIRMLNSDFNALTHNHDDYYPPALRRDIDTINAFVYEHINNGVYRCGFATTQAAYDAAYERLFSALDMMEERLSSQRYLVGQQITEADVRLFTTLVRFDAVYVGHFKCNRNRIIDMPNLWGYLRDLFQQKGFGDTVNMEQIKRHYYISHRAINPTQIIPQGPIIDFHTPHDRARFNP